VFVAFVVDWIMQGPPAIAILGARGPLCAKPKRWFDATMLAFCVVVSLLLLAVLGMAVYTSFIKLWPYDLHFCAAPLHVRPGRRRRHRVLLEQRQDGDRDRGVRNDVHFRLAYLLEKTTGMNGVRALIRLLAAIPMGVPGMVLGLGYILFFNHPDNPLNGSITR
jgi:iron(III) transport system permease protein